MSNRNGKELLAVLEQEGFVDFGKFIPVTVVRETLDLDYPDVAAKEVYDRLALIELGAVDYVRNILLGQGMYLMGVKDGYRILTVGENIGQIDQYMSSADRKLNRALKLLKNTPKEPGRYPDQQEARAEMKRDNIRDHRRKMQPPPV